MKHQSKINPDIDENQKTEVRARVENSFFSVALALVLNVTNIVRLRPTVKQRLKDELPEVCHPEVDWLLEKSDLTAKALLRGCKALALSCKNGHLVRQYVYLDYFAGFFLLIPIFNLIPTLIQLAAMTNFTQLQMLEIAGAYLVVGLAIYYVIAYFFLPQSIARQAISVLNARQASLSG